MGKGIIELWKVELAGQNSRFSTETCVAKTNELRFHAIDSIIHASESHVILLENVCTTRDVRFQGGNMWETGDMNNINSIAFVINGIIRFLWDIETKK